MEEVYIWARDILLIIVSMSFFQILIPNSSMEKYLNFIFSLVILTSIARPLLIFTGKTFG